jgi:hypothetical protein
LGLTLSLRLTGWFALDMIAALALLVVTVVVAAAKAPPEAAPSPLPAGIDGPRPAYPTW